jgi:hypothetical protein
MKTKTTISNSLKKRLKAYSMTAGAVAAGITSVNAQIDYTDIDPDTMASNTDTVQLDLNNDGVSDFVLVASSNSVSSGALNVYRNFIAPLNNNQVVGSSSSSYFYPYAIQSADTIDGDRSFNGGSNFQTLGWDYFSASATSAAYTYGNIRVNGGDAYIGLQLEVNGNTHYGWARISLDLGGTLTLKDYAYEQTACLGIEAGATTGGVTGPIAPEASNIEGYDGRNTGTGLDLDFSFDVAISADGVSEYRTFAVKAGSTFDLAAAQMVASGSYVSSTPPNLFPYILDNFDGVTDSDGDAIADYIEYYIYVLSINDCVNAQIDALAVSSESIELKPPLGLGDLNKFGYSVYSNSNSIFINTNQVINSLTVTSIDGKVVFNKTNLNGNQQIDLNTSSGIYLVNIQTTEGVFSEKVLLK